MSDAEARDRGTSEAWASDRSRGVSGSRRASMRSRSRSRSSNPESAPVVACLAASALSEVPSLRPVAPSSGRSSVDVPFAETWRLIQGGEPADEVAQHYRENITPDEASSRAFQALLRPPSGEPAPQARARIIDVDVHGDGVYISLFIRFARS